MLHADGPAETTVEAPAPQDLQSDYPTKQPANQPAALSSSSAEEIEPEP